MKILLKITTQHRAGEDTWAQKFFSAAASLHGQEKAQGVPQQRHRQHSVPWLCLQNHALHLLSPSSTGANCHQHSGKIVTVLPLMLPCFLSPLSEPGDCPIYPQGSGRALSRGLGAAASSFHSPGHTEVENVSP